MTQRLDALDLLRGISIIGILFMNVYHHALFEIGYSPLAIPPLSDKFIDVVNAFFIDGRFRTIFCLLFGVGLALLWDKYNQDLNSDNNVLKARLKWLMVFGLVHSIFLFSGDILVNYSLAGMLVLRKLHEEPIELVNTAKKYLILGLLMLCAISLLPVDTVYRHSEEFNIMFENRGLGYDFQLVEQLIFTGVMFFFSLVCFMWISAGIMIIGVYLYRTHFFVQGLSKKHFYVCVVITLVISSIDAAMRYHFTDYAQYSMSVATISGFFCALLYCDLVINFLLGKAWLSPFKKAGKLAFTLYILQSVILIIWFRVAQPDYILSATRIDYIAIVLILSLLQLVFAHYYLKYFKIGPVEWIWRKAYQK